MKDAVADGRLDAQTIAVQQAVAMPDAATQHLAVSPDGKWLLTAGAMPIGVQVIAKPYNEQAALQVAHHLEKQGVCVSTPA